MSAVLSTDLSSAFDTVNISILKRKLEHYGIRNGELELIIDYLSERKQFVQIETAKSKIKASPPSSVLQGSKLSSLLYTIYSNEVPLLHTLLEKPIILQKLVKNENIINIKKPDCHMTINYIDDSNSIIMFNDPANLKMYLEIFFKLLNSFYSSNKLLINPEKN